HLQAVLAQGCWTPTVPFNSDDGWHAQALRADGSVLAIHRGECLLGELRWQLQGAHNQSNALAALAAAREDGVAPPQAVAAWADVGGVKRRLELLGRPGGVTVYDDFALRPAAIASTRAGLRAAADNGRILAVFAPRSNTMRAGVHTDRLAGSLAAADHVFVLDQELDWNVGEVLEPLHGRLTVATNAAALVRHVAAHAAPGDIIVIMSNGSFEGLHANLLAALS